MKRVTADQEICTLLAGAKGDSLAPEAIRKLT